MFYDFQTIFLEIVPNPDCPIWWTGSDKGLSQTNIKSSDTVSMERLNCIFASGLLVLVQRHFKYNPCIYADYQLIFFRSRNETRDLTFVLIEVELSVTSHVNVFRLFGIWLLVQSEESVRASRQKRFIAVWQIQKCLNWVVLTWTCIENRLELPIYSKVQKLSVVCTNNESVF